MPTKKGILLVNLGTPDSSKTADVRRYLGEFLMDDRVIDINPVLRTLLVKGVIVPFRSPKSAKTYQKIWTSAGSPLLVYSQKAAELLQENLGNQYQVELAMRYQQPSIASALRKLKAAQVDSIKVIPLFPQYASATTGSVHQQVMKLVSRWQTIPHLEFINSFYTNDKMLSAFAEHGKKYNVGEWDHILFSFHGLPQRQLLKSDDSKVHCLKEANCCAAITDENKFCYSAQCYATARLIADKLVIASDQYTVCFQSRLGKEPWTQPYTSEVIKRLAQQGAKRVLVFCPAFVADCLETIYEIGVEYDEEFRHHGGEKIQLVESLNDHPLWIEALSELVK